MAEQDKQYLPKSGAKLVTFQSGKQVMKLSMKQETLDWLQTKVNSKGYVNIGISERREVGKFGDTHTVWLDTWEPGQTRTAPPPAGPRPPLNLAQKVAWPDDSKPAPATQQAPDDPLPF
jgi:hypothetical protein